MAEACNSCGAGIVFEAGKAIVDLPILAQSTKWRDQRTPWKLRSIASYQSLLRLMRLDNSLYAYMASGDFLRMT